MSAAVSMVVAEPIDAEERDVESTALGGSKAATRTALPHQLGGLSQSKQAGFKKTSTEGSTKSKD